MEKPYSFDDLRRLLSPAQNIFVCLPGSVNFDQVASALALYLSLVKSGKQVSVLSPEEMVVEYSHLVGVDKITNQVTGGELVITIDVPIENIEKITSHDEGQKLSLSIRPKPGTSPLGKENLLFSSNTAAADLLLVIEARRLESLGKIYQENQALFKEKPMVILSHYPKAEPFGQLNLIDPAASCCSELTLALLTGLGLPMDEDISSNLFLGLENGTQNFLSQGVTAETFEAAAFCLRNGAGRSPVAPRKEKVEPTEEPPIEENPPVPSPDWFEPKIYKGSTLP